MLLESKAHVSKKKRKNKPYHLFLIKKIAPMRQYTVP